MSRQLILVRHSLPEITNDVPALQWKLSEEGKARVERMVERLITYRPEILFSSPEPKAVETAEIISKALLLPVYILEDLQEHKRSRVPFLSRSEFEKVVQEFFEKPDDLIFGDETANESFERFSAAVSSALAENPSNTTMIVSHGTVMSLFVSRMTGKPAFDIWRELGLPGFLVLDLQTNQIISLENIL